VEEQVMTTTDVDVISIKFDHKIYVHFLTPLPPNNNNLPISAVSRTLYVLQYCWWL